MRNERIRHRILLLTILTLSLTLAPAMLAQQRSGGSATPVEAIQDERQAVPIPNCKNYSEYPGGTDDQFKLPPETPQLSPGLQSFFNSKGQKIRNYDQGGSDIWFGQSFFIKCCKVCRAELEIRVRSEGGLASNDAIYIGRAPFTPSSNVLAAGHIWDNTRPAWAGGTASPKVMNIPLSPAALNNWINSADGCNVPIDILVQDDTAVDYMKLKIWTY